MAEGKAIVQYFTEAHSGPGWYVFSDDYREEGSVGPFDTANAAVSFARREANYVEVEIVEDAHE